MLAKEAGFLYPLDMSGIHCTSCTKTLPSCTKTLNKSTDSVLGYANLLYGAGGGGEGLGAQGSRALVLLITSQDPSESKGLSPKRGPLKNRKGPPLSSRQTGPIQKRSTGEGSRG